MPKKTELDLLMEGSEEEVAKCLINIEIMIIALATHEYSGPLGIKPYDVKIDIKKVEENFECLEIWEYLLSRFYLMDRICGKYDLEFPTDSKKTKKKHFREWLEGAAKKQWPADIVSDFLGRHDYLCDFMDMHVAKWNEEQRRSNEK